MVINSPTPPSSKFEFLFIFCLSKLFGKIWTLVSVLNFNMIPRCSSSFLLFPMENVPPPHSFNTYIWTVLSWTYVWIELLLRHFSPYLHFYYFFPPIVGLVFILGIFGSVDFCYFFIKILNKLVWYGENIAAAFKMVSRFLCAWRRTTKFFQKALRISSFFVVIKN